tara:strand:- start:656 stop:2311 length:1656 start_codon:yes stop_codon:yes gene_type:complete
MIFVKIYIVKKINYKKLICLIIYIVFFLNMEGSILKLIAEAENGKELSKKQKKNQKKYEKKKMKKQQGNDKSIDNTIDTEEMRLKKIMMEVSIRKLEMKYGKSESDFAKENYGFLFNKSMYKIKDFIIHYLAKNKIEIGKIWRELCYNSHAIFIFLDKDNFEFIRNETGCILQILYNKNTEFISRLLFEELIKSNSLNFCGSLNLGIITFIWEDICKYGNKAVMGVLEEYAEKYKYKYEKLYPTFYKHLCGNPNAINLIKKYYNKYFELQCLENLCKNTNPEALVFVEAFIEDIDISYNDSKHYLTLQYYYNCNDILCENPSAIYLIEKKKNNVYHSLFKNPNAISIIENTMENVNPHEWYLQTHNLSENKNAIHLIEKEDYIHYDKLAGNENGIKLLEKNLELAKKYNYTSSQSIQFTKLIYKRGKGTTIEEEDDETPYNFKFNLCNNPNSIEFLEKYPKYLNENILRNPNIFEINWDYLSSKFNNFNKSQIQKIINDYEKRNEYLSENKLILDLSKEELMQKLYKPSRLDRYLKSHNYDICEEIYCEED